MSTAENSSGANSKVAPNSLHAHALARLQASRTQLLHILYPAPDPGPADGHGAFAHPLGALARWWRRTKPAVVVGQWINARPSDAQAIHGAGSMALAAAQQWLRQHPVASVAIAATLGVVLVRGRAHLLAASASLGRGLFHQGRSWIRTRISDPALYVLLATWLAKAGADQGRSQPASEQGPDTQ